jgi:hypothetical protein
MELSVEMWDIFVSKVSRKSGSPGAAVKGSIPIADKENKAQIFIILNWVLE